MTDASHVRNAIARFDETIGVRRALAFANIKKAAKHYGIEIGSLTGKSWAAARAPAAPPKIAGSRRRRLPRRARNTKAISTNRPDAKRAPPAC
jgi:hypothetical protein